MGGEKLNYEKFGLKAGLEIHQQLDVGGKLFCKCPTYLQSGEPEFIVKRRLHRVAGESGEVDVAVEYEASLGKEFIYQGYRDNVCLVDLDEEPPHLLNSLALDEVLKIALLLNCEIYQNSQIMRKTVIDGSNTAGFQRTVLIAHDGFLETSFGKVRIDSIALEEDSGRLVNENDKSTTYNLDRLGIPLIEIATAPDMNNPEQIKETALKIGEIIRACKVKRGIGTIRQDLNISIKGHDRVEIKGFQEPKMMIKTADLEIQRQLEDIKNKKIKGEVRGALPDGKTKFNRPIPGKARMYPETDLPLLYISKGKIDEMKKHLPKLKSELRDELKKKGVSAELIDLVIGEIDEFNTLMKVYDKDANLIAKMIVLWRNEIANKVKKNEEEIRDILSERTFERVLEALREKKINEGDVRLVLIKIASGESVENALKIERINDDEVEREIRAIVKSKPGLRANAYMGLVMAKLKGKIDAKKAMEILRKLVED
ncbi:MAG: Glu-tRNA(Gln) amidotransferase subunit GatE [archaeon]|nr:Glu-tRNA(Gln) amidotransferase subunit GatE [archaeon]